ncbi:hypothetical protein E2542_SST27572 [Spatholobus suberectus]|nr:hypothetical protein E2542_SST27572 [Spatholobus suberectus]
MMASRKNPKGEKKGEKREERKRGGARKKVELRGRRRSRIEWRRESRKKKKKTQVTETGTSIFSRTLSPSRVYRVVVTAPYYCGVVRHAPTVSTNHQPRPRHRCTATAAGCRSLSHKPLPNPTTMMCDPPSTAMFPSRNLRVLKFLSRGEGLCAP